jgi:hypothetical protein
MFDMKVHMATDLPNVFLGFRKFISFFLFTLPSPSPSPSSPSSSSSSSSSPSSLFSKV